MNRRLVGLVLTAALHAAELGAQSVETPRLGSGEAEGERPGLFRVGSFYLTPYLHVGNLGVDTNVFYSETDRQTDFTASGGPGLEVVRPFGYKSRFRLDGGLDYLYFAKTESQRRLNGYGTADLVLRGVKTRFVVQERYEDTFSRPNYEVNDRIQQQREGTYALLERDLGDRLRLVLLGSRQNQRTDSYDYLGTDLGNTLTDKQYQAGGELQLGLSIKTRLVGGGNQSWYRYPNLPERDGDSTLAYGGFRTDETALITGAALAGMRWFRLDTGGRRDIVYVSVYPTWIISSKTKLGAYYTRDMDYSSLAQAGSGTPTNLTEIAEAFFEKFLTRSIYLRLYARQYRLISDGKVVLVSPDEGVVVEKRNDRAREAGGELGYQFRTKVRAAIKVSYTDRVSTIETFGIQGLLAGFVLQYNPPQPTFR